MKIELTNDGKGKHQSWEAKAVLNADFTNSWALITLEAYGATEAEARANLGELINEVVKDFTKAQNNGSNLA